MRPAASFSTAAAKVLANWCGPSLIVGTVIFITRALSARDGPDPASKNAKAAPTAMAVRTRIPDLQSLIVPSLASAPATIGFTAVYYWNVVGIGRGNR